MISQYPARPLSRKVAFLTARFCYKRALSRQIGLGTVSATNQAMRRKLTVILASDVAGYSRLVAMDEEDTVRRFREAAAEFAALVKQHQGRIFNTAGDAILAEFASAVDATRCAIAIQDSNNARSAAVPSQRQLVFRIGLAVGDVVIGDTGDLLGDAVNVAARLEGIADPGGICASEEIVTHVQNKIPLGTIDIGKQSLRNIQRPIRAFKIAPNVQTASGSHGASTSKRQNRFPKLHVLSMAAIATAVLAVVLIWKLQPFSQLAAPAVAGPPFDAAKVPLVTDLVRSSLADFARQPSVKAVAISRVGWGVATGARDTLSAEREALDRCRKRDQKGDCRIYALGNTVVWPPLRLPLPADLHAEPLNEPLAPQLLAAVKGAPNAAGLQAYLADSNHKALAISESGFSSMKGRETQAEAIRLAVERCSDFARSPCLLLSVDGLLSVKIPTSYGVVRPFTLAGEIEMPETDKDRIGQVYSDKDWRALARGASNQWYAVSAMASETAAADGALKVCHAAEQACKLWAVGNFRVAEKR
jgi:adenylate cyclase